MLGDFVGAAGCDGQGNALAGGANKLFGMPGAPGQMGQFQQHPGSFMGDDIEGVEHAGMPAAAGWHEEFQAPAGWHQEFQNAGPMMQGPMMVDHHAAAAAAAAGPPVDWAAEMQMMHPDPGAEGWVEQFRQRQPEGEQWAADFNTDDVQTFGVEGEATLTFEEKAAAAQSTQFAEPQRATGAQEDAWANEFAGMEGGDWAEQFQGQMPNMEELMKEYGGEDWAETFQDMMGKANTAGYEFEENNPYMSHQDPFQEGLELLEAGTLCEAVLAFEAAVQRDEGLKEGWKNLGVSQAANEKDRHAIAALEKARLLDPADPATLQQLAVSYTNEGLYDRATTALSDWMSNHPVHGEFARKALAAAEASDGMRAAADPEAAMAEQYMDYRGMDSAAHKRACQLFERVAETSKDPAVHEQLGVLYNMSQEFLPAARHFQAAIDGGRQGDVKLWNRLGATLANGGKHPEAVRAYNRAVDLNPGFVRAHFNLGISLNQMKQHKDAATTFLRALDMQQSTSAKLAAADGHGNPYRNGTSEIWDALRMTFDALGRRDLYDLTWKGDSSVFTGEFPTDPFADNAQW
eukprot:Hpha_TRINITY_DN10274_c0_g1::TRINITY_DN10274_c0_g1_i1::g.35001::m.35001/K13342/PEX5, PXR1; peroxin-5